MFGDGPCEHSSWLPHPLPRRPSDSKKKKQALKKAGSKASLKGSASASQLSEAENSAANGLADALEEFALNDRSTTGVLTSHPQSRDIHFESFSLLYHGHELLTDTRLELNYGRCAAACCAVPRCLACTVIGAPWLLVPQCTPAATPRPRRSFPALPADAAPAAARPPARPQALRPDRPQRLRQELPAQGAGSAGPGHPGAH